jgi:hypothetical protein
MDLRHVGAVTLLIWYLIVPPMAHVTRDEKTDIVTADSARLNSWLIMGSYDSADECNAARIRKASRAKPVTKGLTKEEIAVAKALLRTEVENMICIDNDDPRLKGK